MTAAAPELDALSFDGGLEVFPQIAPLWSGEDAAVDVPSVAGAVQFPNLWHVNIPGLGHAEIAGLQARGVRVAD